MRGKGIAAASLAVFALVAVACRAPQEQAGPAEQSPGAPAAVQELTVAYGADQFMLELNRKRLTMYPLNANVCEPLVQLTTEFEVAPLLAESWEYAGDNTYRFVLRDGVRFHDGAQLNAEAVEFSLDLTAQEPKTNYSFLSEDSAKVVDPTTVEVQPTKPNLRLVEQLLHPTYSIMPVGTDPTVEPVCTGPFTFVDYVQNDHLTVERNDDYWGEPAKLEKITFRFIPDDSTRALALQSGEVDVIADVNRAQVDSLRETPGIKVVTAPPGQVILLYIAQRDAQGPRLTADRSIRRAIAHAIDETAFVEQVLDGNAEVVSTVNPPEVLGEFADQVEGIPYDPQEAARILDEAGWRPGPDGVRTKDGRRLTLSTIFDSTRVTPDVAQYVQAQLAEVGIEANIEQLDKAAYQDRVDTGGYDLDLETPNQNDANPAFLLALRWYSKSSVDNARFVSVGPEFDALIEQALNTPHREEVQRLAADAMRLLVDEEAAAVPLAGTYRIYAMKENVEGFDPHPSGINQSWATVFLTE